MHYIEKCFVDADYMSAKQQVLTHKSMLSNVQLLLLYILSKLSFVMNKQLFKFEIANIFISFIGQFCFDICS